MHGFIMILILYHMLITCSYIVIIIITLSTELEVRIRNWLTIHYNYEHFIDYFAFPNENVQQICPSKLNLLSQIPENGQKMANGWLLFQALFQYNIKFGVAPFMMPFSGVICLSIL